MTEDPFKHYVRGYGSIAGKTKHQPQEFKQSFHEAVDAIRAGKVIDESHFGRSEFKEERS